MEARERRPPGQRDQLDQRDQRGHLPADINTEKLKKAFDISHFDLNAIIRGIQLTLVAANRALQNPSLFSSEHYKQAALAVAAGLAIRLIISIPVSEPSPLSLTILVAHITL